MEKVYQILTDRIIERLEAGVIPWRKPWKSAHYYGKVSPGMIGPDHPRNGVSGRVYHGFNVIMTMSMGYSSPYWYTYNQTKKLGAQVRKGEHGLPIMFWKFLEKEDATTKKRRTIPMLRYFTVFNAEQIENLPEKADDWDNVLPVQPEALEPVDYAIPAEVAKYLEDGGPRLIHAQSDRAFYSWDKDEVVLPTPTQFKSKQGYYSTLYHELGHSTGHETRLSRKFGKRFGDPNYAREELVAEITVSFLCAHTGVMLESESEENTVAYLQSWICRLQEDPRAIVVAAGAAEKAANLIVGEASTLDTSGG